MPHVTEAEVFRACRTLFGPELKFDRAFLSYLQPSGARSAYRKKAKVIHPDRFAVSCSSTKIKQQRLFQDLNQAHQTVQKYLKQKKSYPRPTDPPQSAGIQCAETSETTSRQSPSGSTNSLSATKATAIRTVSVLSGHHPFSCSDCCYHLAKTPAPGPWRNRQTLGLVGK